MPELPTNLPADKTPNTYSGTQLKTYLLAPNATSIIPSMVLTNTAGVAANATSISLSAPSTVEVPSGTVLTFGTVQVTTAAAATITNGASTAVSIQPAAAAVANGATADYTNLLEVPIAEESNPTLADQEETINVHGRITPIRVVNGKDMTASIKTLGGIDDPVVKRLITKGMSISPNNKERIIWVYPDGFALLATVNIGAPTRQAAPAGSQRVTVSANLSGGLYWANLNDQSPTWKQVNGN